MRGRAAATVAGAIAAATLSVPMAASAVPSLSWQLVKTRCVAGVVHLEVAISGAVAGESYAIYATSGSRASTEEITAPGAEFTATFTPNEAYGSNDASHFSVTGDVEAPGIGQRSQVRTISAACAATTGPPATVPSTLSTSLGFDVNALGPRPVHHKSHTARTALIALAVALVVLAAVLIAWRRLRSQRE